MSSRLNCPYCFVTYYELSTLKMHLSHCPKNPYKGKSWSDDVLLEDSNMISNSIPKKMDSFKNPAGMPSK